METSGEKLYTRITKQKNVILLGLLLTTIIVFIADICIGPSWLSVSKIVSTIFNFGSPDSKTHVIVWDIRLPMALAAIIIGSGLAIAGAEMQTILNNPLASPFTLGISGAASFGAALTVVLRVGLFVENDFAVSVNAFVFAMLTCVLIYSIGKLNEFGIGIVVLAGIAVSLFFQSALATVEYFANEEQLNAVVFWMFGSLARITWLKLGIVTTSIIITIPILLANSWKLTALRLGEEKAKNLGVNVKRLKIEVFILVSIITAVAICFSGIIGFIGLVAPHIARMLVGEDQRFFLPTTALSGAIFLSLASIASKTVDHGSIFPIGILTSLIGLPFFIALLVRTRRQYW